VIGGSNPLMGTMKQNNDIESRMKPGRSSQAGFLGEHDSLDGVIAADKAVLSNLGLTYNQFADRLETITQKAQYEARNADEYWDTVEKGIIVDGNFEVKWNSYMGYQHCPYGCKDGEAKSDTDYTIKNIKTGESVFFSLLHIHLIRQHQFFEGNTQYRLDPEICARVIGIEKGVDYTPQYESKEFWVTGCGGFSSGCKTVEDLLEGIYSEDSKHIMKTGKPIKFESDQIRGWQLDNNLLIASLLENQNKTSDRIIVNEIPIYHISYGQYRYEKRTLKWIRN
jgi:hypothetical protein